MSEKWHGTRGGYTNHACRCTPCTKAHAEYQLDFRRTNARTGLAPDDPRHGSINAYTNYACRCIFCRNARMVAKKARA